MQQQLFTLPEHLRSPSVLIGVRFARSLVLRVFFGDRCFTFLFLLAFVLFILLRYTDSHCPFGVFKLFFLPLCCLFFDIRILIASLWCLQTLLTLFVFDCVFVLFFLVLLVSVASFSVLSSLIDPSIFPDVYILPEDC